MARRRSQINPSLIGAVLVMLGSGGLLTNWLMGGDALQPAPTSDVESRSANNAAVSSVPTATMPERTACRVLTVYDGDTLGCDLDRDGKIQRPTEEIRLLGIDSPEMHYSRKNPTYGSAHPTDEPLAKAASQWLEAQTDRKTVYLEFDQRREDKYGRTLAYVYSGLDQGTSLNEQAIAQGYASVLIIGKNRLHEAQLRQAEEQARTANRGVWGLAP